MTTIPERIQEEAQRIAELANECCYRMDGYEENIREQVEQALLAAEKRGREEAGKIADDYSERAIKANPPAQEASAAAQNIAAAIRSTN
jgi:hypothetical protein